MDFSGCDHDGDTTHGDPLVQAFVWAVRSLSLPLPGAGPTFERAVNNSNYAAVGHLVQCFLVVRLYLVHVIESLGFIPCSAENYFLTQLTSWAGKCSATAFRAVARFPADEVQRTLDDLAGRVGQVVLAIDEAGAAAQLLENTFRSDSEAHLGNPRGLLGPVLCSASNAMAVVLAGTTLRLHHCEAVGSGHGKSVPLVTITEFPTMTEEQSSALLRSLLRVPEHEEEAAVTAVQLLSGKGRYMQVLWERFDCSKHGKPGAFLSLVRSVRADLVDQTKRRALAAIDKGPVESLWC
jgi:hypothetical protein